ncbi:MAG: L-lactate MFS transporter [Candidatus Hodarchaeales archaeon]
MSDSTKPLFNRYFVVIGALIVQVCLGSIYAWSIFQTSLKAGPYNWDVFSSLLPFATGLATFAIVMVIAGKWQDKVGPRKVATIGGIFLGVGYLLASGVKFFETDPLISLLWVIVTYGIIGGAGIGLAYVCPIAALVKWFPDKKGAITGIAVAGFGLGALIVAQLETAFITVLTRTTDGKIATSDVSPAFLLLGIIYLIAVVASAQLLRNPPAGWKPEGWEVPAPSATGLGKDYIWQDMLKTPQFWLLWFMFSFAATAGLMTLGILKSFLQVANTGIDDVMAASIVGVVAIFNAGGRIFWGTLSDRMGRIITMLCMFALLIISMFLFGFMTDIIMLIIIGAAIGLCFGGNFSLFPSTTADYFGTKNVGNNYGFVFTAYGVAGVLGALIPTVMLSGITASVGTDYAPAFLICAVLALFAALLAVLSEYLNRKNKAAA